MISSARGAAQILCAANLIESAFARRKGADAVPDARLILDLGGKPIEILVFSADSAKHLRGIFRHLLVEDTAQKTFLTIELAELHETETAFLTELSAPAEGVTANPIQGHVMVELFPGLAITFNRAAGRVTAISGPTGSLPPSYLSHPFAHALGWLAGQSQAYVTHGAVIGRHGRGILIAGSGGKGKSTTALTCARAGWDYAGDDLMVLKSEGDMLWVAHSLYASGRLHPAQAVRFPDLVAKWDSVLSSEDMKLTLFPRADAVSLVRKLPVEAIVLPLVVPQAEAGISRLPRAHALRSLMADSVRIYPWLTRERAQFYARAVEQLPCYALRVGPDIDAIPAAMERILDMAPRLIP